MKKISSWSCLVVGVFTIILSFVGIFISLDGFRRPNLPFQILIISLKCGLITFPKPTVGSFIGTLSLPVFDYIFSIILIVSGIGILWMKRWGRTFGYICSMSMIFISGIGLPIFLLGYIREFSRISRNPSFMDGIIWGGIGVYY